MPYLTHPALKTAGRLRTMLLVRGNREYMLTAPVLLNSEVSGHPSLLFDSLALRHPSTCVWNIWMPVCKPTSMSTVKVVPFLASLCQDW